jgi:hypothetical protein
MDLIIHLPKTFDVSIIAWLEERLAKLPSDTAAVLDFSRVASCQAWALAAVATWLGSLSGRRVRARGLTDHQEKMLRYVRGLPVGRRGARET